jgi:hypothetical protein
MTKRKQIAVPKGFSDQLDAVAKLRLINEASANKRLAANAVRLLIALLEHFAGERGCFPSYEQQGERAVMSRTTAKRSMRSLKREGFVYVDETDGGRNLRNRYYFKTGSLVTPNRVTDDPANRVTGDPRSNPTTPTPPNNPRHADARVRQELGKHLDADHVTAVIDHRRALRKPLTAHAARLLAAALAEHADPNAAADIMIRRGWISFEAAWLTKAADKELAEEDTGVPF